MLPLNYRETGRDFMRKISIQIIIVPILIAFVILPVASGLNNTDTQQVTSTPSAEMNGTDIMRPMKENSSVLVTTTLTIETNNSTVTQTSSRINGNISPTVTAVQQSIEAGQYFNREGYQLPDLRFDKSQQKIVVDRALSPPEENTVPGAALRKGSAMKEDNTYEIPEGAVIYHSADGITTVFDKHGTQLFSAKDSQAGIISTPGEDKPATLVHEIPSGSVVYPEGNATFVVFNGNVILAEINDNPKDSTLISGSVSSIPSPGIIGKASPGISSTYGNTVSPMDSSPATDFDPTKYMLERIALNYENHGWSNDIGNDTVQWVIPAAPKTVRSNQIQYLELLQEASDQSTLDPNTSYSSNMNFVSASEFNRIANSWDMSVWIQDTNVSNPTYYTPGISETTGEKLTGEILTTYIFNSTYPGRIDSENWSVSIRDRMGNTQNLNYVSQAGHTVMSPWGPEYRLEASGDNSMDSENNLVGDTTFSNFSFTDQTGTPINPASIPVMYSYVNTFFSGKPQFSDVKIGNNWSNSLTFGTQAPPPLKYSITCIENYDYMCDENGTHCNIPGSIQECDNFANKLNDAGYGLNFYHKDGDVIADDFGTNLSYSGPTITDSAFHYHSGHGTNAFNLGWWTFLNLKDSRLVWVVLPPPAPPSPVPVLTGGYVDSAMVAGKWGGNLKWVMLDSCNILQDANWAKALVTAHGILGFSTQSYVSLTFPETFMNNATNPNYTIVDAYKQATLDTYHDDNITATVITKTLDQYNQDHFPGTGYMAPDGDPNNNNPFIRHWTCRSDVEW